MSEENSNETRLARLLLVVIQVKVGLVSFATIGSALHIMSDSSWIDNLISAAAAASGVFAPHGEDVRVAKYMIYCAAPAVIVTAIGAAITWKGQRHLVLVYILAVMGLLGIATIALILIFNYSEDEAITKPLTQSLALYKDRNETDHLVVAWDAYQTKFRCCGVTDWTDWTKVASNGSTWSRWEPATPAMKPRSCCLATSHTRHMLPHRLIQQCRTSSTYEISDPSVPSHITYAWDGCYTSLVRKIREVAVAAVLVLSLNFLVGLAYFVGLCSNQQ